MPLDAMFPATRLSYVLSDASAAAVITTEEYRYRIDELKLSIPVVYINAEDLATNPLVYSPSSENIASPEDEAYIVYTSGSTGKPKGVPVLHKGAVNTMMHGTIKFDLEGARMLQFFAIGFDGFQSDMWSALTQGATLVLRSDNNLDDLLSTIDMVTITPTGLSLLGDPDKYPRLRCVGVAGESVPTSLRDLWADKVHLINCYGPSEGSMGTHYETIYPGNAITIGNPFANVNAYVLDDLQRPVPIGVIGELYLGGVCVSPSYINLPEETATRFLADPFTGGRMFRTGDVARLLSNGKMEVLGRQDSQVKMKGYRIELDEVAEAMMQHPRVITAAAIVKSKTQLIGYFTPADVPTIELRQIVADILPTYMVPSIWVGLDSMPQNVNGKTDKKALEAMDIVLEVDTPETEEEKQMAQVWANVLNVRVDEIGRNSSFLALGGDSISAIKVVAACSALGVSLSAAQLFKGAVLSRVAEISTKLGCTIWPSVYLDKEVVDEITESWSKKLNLDNFIVYPATPLQAGMVYATMSNSSSYITQMPVALEENTTTDALITAFKQLVERHEILRTTFVTSTTGIVQVIRSDIVGLEVDISSLQLENFLSDDLARGFSLGDKVVDYIEAQDKKDTQDYWSTYLSGVVPSHLSGASNIAYSSGEDSRPLSLVTTLPLVSTIEVAKKLGITVAVFVKLAWAITVRKYTRSNDVVFGQVLANRDIPVQGAERILGPLLSTVPCRVQFDDLKSAKELASVVQTQHGLASTHSYASLTDIKHWSGVEANLYDSLFVYQNLPDAPTNPNEDDNDASEAPIHSASDNNYELIVEPNGQVMKVRSLFNPSKLAWSDARNILMEFDYSLTQLHKVAENSG
ncbi:unnamed protein product, partial [Aphanomyces euteiches]